MSDQFNTKRLEDKVVYCVYDMRWNKRVGVFTTYDKAVKKADKYPHYKITTIRTTVIEQDRVERKIV